MTINTVKAIPAVAASIVCFIIAVVLFDLTHL